METISNVASSAGKIIWGEGQQTEQANRTQSEIDDTHANNSTMEPQPYTEPVSGQRGTGTLNEPFDKGNDPTATAIAASETNSGETGKCMAVARSGSLCQEGR